MGIAEKMAARYRNLMSAPPPTAFVNARLVDPETGVESRGGLLVEDGRILDFGAKIASGAFSRDIGVIDCAGNVLSPGLIDLRAYLGEPGGEHRESIATATAAAAAGGVTTIVASPETSPVTDDPAVVDFLKRRARDHGRVRVLPAAAISKGLEGKEISEFGLLREAGAVAFTDGSRSIRNSQTLRRALTYARDFDALIVHFPEDRDLAGAGVMNAGELATRLGLSGAPREAEAIALDRDIRLVRMTGARYCAAPISTTLALETIAKAKAEGLPVSCGVTINHLTLNENDIGDYRTFLKVKPPLRREEERLALVEARRQRPHRHHLFGSRPAGRRDQAPAVRRGRFRRGRPGNPACRPPCASSTPAPSRCAQVLRAMTAASRGHSPSAAGPPEKGRAGRPDRVRPGRALCAEQGQSEIALQEHALRRGAFAGRGEDHHGRGRRGPWQGCEDFFMSGVILLAGAAVAGYLLGSIPFGLLLTKAAGLGDVRDIGSGNIGATNVLRTGTKRHRRRHPGARRAKSHRRRAAFRPVFAGCRGRRRLLRLSRAHFPGLAEIQGRQGRRDLYRLAAGRRLAGGPRLRRDLAGHGQAQPLFLAVGAGRQRGLAAGLAGDGPKAGGGRGAWS